MAPGLRRRLSLYDGPKLAFVQDEYKWVDEMTAALRELGISVLFSVVPPAAVETLYGSRLPGVAIVPTLTGYVPPALVDRRTPPLLAREIDVGYRTRTVPFWLGRLGQEKVAIGRGFLERADGTGLRCDIAWTEEERIYGERWNEFVASCKATLGTVSGASVADFDGSLRRRVDEYLMEHPAAGFEEVHAAVLAPHEGNVIIDVVSPRVFEAAALRTALVLFPGSYSGVIEPWAHYLPLERDFSNMPVIVERLRDSTSLHELTERAHADLVASGRYSYESFIRDFDERVAERVPARARRPPRRYYATRLEALVFRLRLALRLRARLGALSTRARPFLAGGWRR
jgi:hypothetical protein